MITVMGANGNTGKKITETLLKTGEKVQALGRSQNRLEELKRAGAEVLAGDASDAGFMEKAFHRADAVYTLLPTDRRSPDYRAEQDRQGEAIVEAIRRSGLRYVVALSSLGADLSEGTVRSRGCTHRKNASNNFRTLTCCCFDRYPFLRISTKCWVLSSTRGSTVAP